MDVSMEEDDSKKEEVNVGRPQWEQIHVKEELARASKTWELS